MRYSVKEIKLFTTNFRSDNEHENVSILVKKLSSGSYNLKQTNKKKQTNS